MAKKDMHTYVSRLKDNELKTLIATYDIPLDLRPRLPDPNFRMINLPAEDTAIGIYSMIFDSSSVRIPFSSFLLVVLKYFKVHISQLVPLGLSKGGCFSFAKHRDPAPVCMEGVKSGLKLWKEKFFLIDRRTFPFYMPSRNTDSCITDRVPTSFNQGHVDQLKAHIMILHDISKGVLVRSGLSRVWRNPMCDPVLRRSDNTVMSIYDFLCMPSLDKVTVREEPHGLDTSILGRVADRTTLPAPAGTTVPRASPKGQRYLPMRPRRPDRARNGLEQHDGLKFAIEGIESLNNVSQGEYINVIPLRTFNPSIGLDMIYPPILLPDKEVEPHAELSGGVRRATRASFHASHDDGGNDSDGNVDPYHEARISNTAGIVLERDLLPFEEIHGVNLGLQKKELYKDPKVCRTALDRFPAPAETH
ncbi:hypothetical protein Tco_1389566 [Tanacetum coccineum]